MAINSKTFKVWGRVVRLQKNNPLTQTSLNYKTIRRLMDLQLLSQENHMCLPPKALPTKIIDIFWIKSNCRKTLYRISKDRLCVWTHKFDNSRTISKAIWKMWNRQDVNPTEMSSMPASSIGSKINLPNYSSKFKRWKRKWKRRISYVQVVSSCAPGTCRTTEKWLNNLKISSRRLKKSFRNK
jgi:hypothetical protein